MTNTSEIHQPASIANTGQKEISYYTASQWQLVWWRFRRHRAALVGAMVLVIMAVSGIFAGFFAPYLPISRDSAYILGPPQIIKIWDARGFSFRPFIHAVKTVRDPVTLRKIAKPDPSKRIYLKLLERGDEYKLFGIIQWNIHLFGVEKGKIHLFGTDDLGRDLFSRCVYATRTSLSIGILGVLTAFILALIIGGVAGYSGGWSDYCIQRLTEVVRVIPVIPLYMGLAAAFPREWTNIQVYFAMTMVFGLIGWTTLSRRIRSHLLSQRNEDYVIAARICGASAYRIISKHLLPSFTSYIIVDLVISFPYIILSETALSFIGLGLRPPTVSWGILLQQAQNIRAIEQAPWLFIPGAFVVGAVLAFTILGDGLRDAADPYTAGQMMPTDPKSDLALQRNYSKKIADDNQSLSGDSLLDVRNLKISFLTDEGIVGAVDGIDIQVNKGRTLGIVGESGSGKSVSVRALMKLLPKNAVYGENTQMNFQLSDGRTVDIAALEPSNPEMRDIRGGEISMIFQEPMVSFSPVYTIGNQIIEVILLHSNIESKEAREIAIEMLDRVGVSNAALRTDQYPHELSGGMRQRAMIAMALVTKPSLLIADEPTTALDMTIQAQILELIQDLQSDLNMAVIFITHNMGVVAHISDDIAVMYLGSIIEFGSTEEVIHDPKHPYTKGLLAALPDMDEPDKRLIAVPGDIPSPLERPAGCLFHTRCPAAIQGNCDRTIPQRIQMGASRFVKCLLYN